MAEINELTRGASWQMWNVDSANFKITVEIQRREDGGLRVRSNEVPGLVLSHRDPDRVIADIQPALEAILSDMLGCAVKAHRLEAFNQQDARRRVSSRMPEPIRAVEPGLLEFAAAACA